jgi:hypothetical protein
MWQRRSALRFPTSFMLTPASPASYLPALPSRHESTTRFFMRCHAMQRRPGSGLHQDWCVPRCDVFGDGARSSRLKDPKAGPHALGRLKLTLPQPLNMEVGSTWHDRAVTS